MALYAGILVRVGSVNLVTFGARLVRFRAASEKRLRFGVVALHAAAALGNPRVRRVTARATAMTSALRANIRVIATFT